MAAAAALAAALAACGPGGRDDIAQSRPPDPSAAERAYRAPPAVLSATALTGRRLLLAGRADPGARVRLATPSGQAFLATADAGGRWRFVLAGEPGVRLYGLSMIEGVRTIQAEGYLAITPGNAVAQLRAGAGARVITPGGILRLLAVDYDRKGGTVVSGTGRPGDTVSARVDGQPKGKIAADAAGRFELALDEPLSGGAHRVEVDDAGAQAEAAISVSPAAPLTREPFAASVTASGWRIDWMTPGGGVQTTLLIEPSTQGPAEIAR